MCDSNSNKKLLSEILTASFYTCIIKGNPNPYQRKCKLLTNSIQVNSFNEKWRTGSTHLQHKG